MKYAKYRSHDKNTILPDPSLWRHKPESVIIEICNSIAEYPHLVKSFAPKNQDIDYAKIKKYKELFDIYDDALAEYMDEGSSLYLCKLIDERVKNRDVMSDEFKQLIQYFYEVQCALTEFYVYINRFHFQFRKTMLPLLSESIKMAIKPYLDDEFKKNTGSNQLYTQQNAELVGMVYEQYLRLGYGLKFMYQYAFSDENTIITQDIEMLWLLCGYMHANYDHQINSMKNSVIDEYKEETTQKDLLFVDILEQFILALTYVGGSYKYETEGGYANECTIENFFKVHDEETQNLKDLFEQGYSALSELNGNAVIKLTSDILNPFLIPDHFYSFELSLFSNGQNMENLVPEFILFGGIYNNSLDCISYPLVFDAPLDLEPIELSNLLNDQFTEFMRSITHMIMVNYPYVYFENNQVAYENQFKRRIDIANHN